MNDEKIGKISKVVVKYVLNEFFLSGKFSVMRLKEMLENIRRESSEISHEEMQQYTNHMAHWLADKHYPNPIVEKKCVSVDDTVVIHCVKPKRHQ